MKTWHPAEIAFLLAIHAAPRDDTPRLVYADWLDEHGRVEQAEYLRIEIEFGQVGIGDPRYGTLHTRRFQLRRALIACPEWLVQIDGNLFIPASLSTAGRQAATAIIEFMAHERKVFTRGCRAFYAPNEWTELEKGNIGDSLLVVVYEGSDLLPMLSRSGDDPALFNRMADHLKRHGFYVSISGNRWATIGQRRRP